MAVYQDPRLMDQKNKTDVLDGSVDASQPQDQSMVTPNAPQQAMTTEGSSPATQQQAAPRPQARSGMFTNIKNYVQKNQPAAENMAGAIGSKVQRTADIARKNIQNVQNQFTNLKEQSTLANRQNAVSDVTQAAQQAASMAEGANTANQDQDKRLASILDAQYKGPMDLRELGTYNEAQQKTFQAQRLADQLSGGSQNRQELLRSTLERPGTRYTEGAKKLDQLLFGQGDPQAKLRQTQEQVGNVIGSLGQAETQARQAASDRAAEILGIRDEARKSLTDISQQRQQEVEDYLGSQLGAGKDLAKYYTDILNSSNTGLDLGELEAETLGVQSGVGMYRLLSDPQTRKQLISDLDRSGQLSKDQLVTLEQQGQLAELQRLNELSQAYGTQGSGLDYRNLYTDADKAGTQTAFDALGLDKFKDYLTEAEKGFRTDAAKDVTGKGKGSAKYKKGWFRGRGKVRKTAYETGNLKDILEDAGYDFKSDPTQYVSDANTDILKDIAKIKQHAKGEQVDLTSAENEMDILAGLAGEDSALWESLGLGDYGKILTGGGVAGIAADATEGLGKGIQDISGGLENAIFGGNNNTLGNLLTDPANIVGKGIEDIGREFGNLTSNIFGSGKSKARKKAKAKAKKKAIKDLQKKLTKKLNSSGFSNRINVADTQATKERQNKLLDLLGNIDTRNLK